MIKPMRRNTHWQRFVIYFHTYGRCFDYLTAIYEMPALWQVSKAPLYGHKK